MSFFKKTVFLLLPAVIPSWRFFDEIAPSPRLEYAVFDDMDKETYNWRELQLNDDKISIIDLIKRLFYNSARNHSLYIMSLSERIAGEDCAHAKKEVLRIVKLKLQQLYGSPEARFFRYRLVFKLRVGSKIERHVYFMSGAKMLRAECDYDA